MSFKTRFPAESALATPLKDSAAGFLHVVEEEIEPHLSDYRKVVLFEDYGISILIGFFFVGTLSLAGVLVPIVSYHPQSEFDGFFIGSLAVLISVSLVSYLMIRHYRAASLVYYEALTKFNDTFYSTVFNIFGVETTPLLSVTHASAPSDESRREIARIFKQSQLFSTFSLQANYNPFSIYNPHITGLDGKKFLMCEVRAKPKSIISRHKLLQGYFIVYELPKTLTGYTYVSTERDLKNNGRNSFFNQTDEFGFPEGIVPTETEFEWNEFEDFLRVISSDHVEARYILTPDFMEDLYAWWKSAEKNIRMTFYGSYLYIYVPTKHVRKNRLPRRMDENTLTQMLHGAASTLLHVFHLIDDVNQRLR